MIRLVSVGLGYGLLTLGVIGLIVPILHGTIFFIVGLLILSRHAVWVARTVDWLKRCHPRVEALIERGEIWVDCWEEWAAVRLGRLFGGRPSA